MSIYTNILTGGINNHETTSENANQLATDFVSEGVVGAITNISGVAPMTGALAVNAQGTPDMTVAVSSGVAYVAATPSGQASQVLRVYNNASANVTIAANSSGSTKYDWVYLSVSAANAAAPNTAGDNVTTLVVSRSSSATADDGTPPTYGYPIAVVTVANAASSITNGNITDIRDVTGTTASRVNFGSGAADIWWEQLKETTLGSNADTITVSSIPARKYLLIVLDLQDTGGTVDVAVRFNNDSDNNYAYSRSVTGAAESSVTSTSSFVVFGTAANPSIAEIFVKNIATQEKLVNYRGTARGSAGAANLPARVEGTAKWANTADQATRVDVINGGGAGDFATGSRVIVLGHD